MSPNPDAACTRENATGARESEEAVGMGTCCAASRTAAPQDTRLSMASAVGW